MREVKYPTPGKPTKYEGEKTLAEVVEYLKECEDESGYEELVDAPNGGKLLRRYAGKVKMPNAGGLAIFLGVNRSTVFDWCNAHPEFKDMVDVMNSVREDRLTQGGLSGAYASNVALVMLGKYGYHRVVDNNISNPDGSFNPMKELTKEQLIALAESQKG